LTTVSRTDPASRPKIVALFGPTASGKTALLERLFCRPDALLPDGAEVVSADSVQVYRGLDIGSAKPEPALLEKLPHHLIDIRSPQQNFSLGDFVALADQACADISARGCLPVVSGGTAFYLKAFLFGLPASPPADLAVRAALQAELATLGPEPLRAELERVDPVSAQRIAPADHYRLQRALEVWRCAGRPLSSFEVPVRPRGRWDILALAIDRPRPELYARIDARVETMLDAGLEAEVAALQASGCTAATPAMKGIGYAEFFATALADQPPAARRAALAAAIAQNSRRYAKRQLTFMRSLPGVRWFQADDPDCASQLAAAIREHLAADCAW